MQSDQGKFRALLLGVRAQGFDTAGAIDQFEALLRAMLPGADVTSHHREGQCKRRDLLDVIDAWIGRARAHDRCLLYYFGHGGRVQFTRLGPAIAERVFTFLSCERESGQFTGLLDLELSSRMAELAERCASVTTIIDSCYSGTIVRSANSSETVDRHSLLVVRDTPAWVERVLLAPPDPRLASESNARIVRLAGASPRAAAHLASSALRVRSPSPPVIGMFTAALLETLRAAKTDWHRLTWDSLAHSIRQRVIVAFGMESQWIAQAGPRNLRVLSTESVDLPRTVGFAETEYGYWIRTGWLAGVEIGDTWALADPFVDDQGRHREIVRGCVDQVELNRSRLALAEPLPAHELSPSAAFVVGLARPVPVALDPEIGLALDSPWLCEGGPQARSIVHLDGTTLVLVDALGEWANVQVENDDRGRRMLIELLEDRARTTRLLENLEKHAAEPRLAPVDWQVGIEAHAIESGAEVASGSCLWVRVSEQRGGGEHWFASVVLVDVIGRSWLLNSSQPDGVELEPLDLEIIGRRPGAARAGIALDWPEGVNFETGGRVRLLLLACGRPIQLGHLVGMFADDELARFRLQDDTPRRTTRRVLSPVPAAKPHWHYRSLDLRLRAPDDAGRVD